MRLEPVATSKKGPNNGPNDASGVVWAISTCFFLKKFLYLFILTDIFSFYLDDEQPTFSQIPYLTSPLPCQKKGPNDASGVVWAIIVRVFLNFI
jgi:hypothetical protein